GYTEMVLQDLGLRCFNKPRIVSSVHTIPVDSIPALSLTTSDHNGIKLEPNRIHSNVQNITTVTIYKSYHSVVLRFSCGSHWADRSRVAALATSLTPILPRLRTVTAHMGPPLLAEPSPVLSLVISKSRGSVVAHVAACRMGARRHLIIIPSDDGQIMSQIAIHAGPGKRSQIVTTDSSLYMLAAIFLPP
ncbi:hypothetical protein L9F63_014231, partial [Diploptera punctata]